MYISNYRNIIISMKQVYIAGNGGISSMKGEPDLSRHTSERSR